MQRGADGGERQQQRRRRLRSGTVRRGSGAWVNPTAATVHGRHRTVVPSRPGPRSGRGDGRRPAVRRRDAPAARCADAGIGGRWTVAVPAARRRRIPMLTRLGQFTVRRHRLVLSMTVLFMVAAAVLGTRAFGVLQDEGFADPARRARAPQALIDERFDADEPNAILVVTSASGDVDDPAVGRRRRAPRRRRPRRRPRRRRHVVLGARRAAGAAQHRRQPRARAAPSRPTATTRTPRSRRSATSPRAAPPGITAAVGGERRRRARHRHDDRGRPRAGRADRHADHAAAAAVRVRRARRRVAAAARRRRRRARHVPVAVRHRLDHRRVDLRRQPDDRARPRAGDRLQPVHRVPLPRGAARRAHRRRRRRARRSRRPGARCRSAP